MERQIAVLLSKEMNMGTLAGKAVNLKEVLEHISTSMTKLNGGNEVLIIVHANAFKAEDKDFDIDRVLAKKVKVPSSAKKMKVSAALRLVTSQFPGMTACHVVDANEIEITSERWLDVEMSKALKEEVTAKFDRRPLAEALKLVAEAAVAQSTTFGPRSLKVVLGPEVGTKGKTRVTAVFARGTSVRDALERLTGMAGLDFVPVANMIYITTPALARKVRSGQRSRRQLLQAIYEQVASTPEADP
jgi:hypothetical protein